MFFPGIGILFTLVFEVIFWGLFVWIIVKAVKSRNSSNHDHSYNHKVKPIEEASGEQSLYNRSESDSQNISHAGKNGDCGAAPADNEQLATCKYCGAKNIIPRYGNNQYTCYFCRQVL